MSTFSLQVPLEVSKGAIAGMTMNIYIVRAQDSGVLKVLLEAFKYLSPEDIDPEEYDIQDDLLRVRHLFKC